MSRTSEPSTAAALACAIREGRISSRDAVEQQLDRIARHNQALNAIVTLDGSGARQRARDADRALAAGQAWGPLHGVPITIKDSFDTAGLRTVCGYRRFKHRVPDEDAAAVARLRAAGAVIIGKTNVPPLANGIQSVNPVFGRTNNPWDLRRTPGGSSGGAAASIAAGLSFLELGSDISGSIRIPAHFCGVYGLKPTAGRVAGKGHVASARRLSLPAGCEALLQLASFGPIARSVDDLELALRILSEQDVQPDAESARSSLAELRLAWTDDLGAAPLDSESRRLIQRFAGTLREHGVTIERQSATVDFDEAWHTAGVCLGAINTLFQSPAKRLMRRLLSPVYSCVGGRNALLRGLFTGMALDSTRIQRALAERTAIGEQIETFLSGWDGWICPVFPTPAFTHRSATAPIDVDGRSVSQLEANLLHSVVFNLTGHPAVTVPIGFSSAGLPVGIQIVGQRWHEMPLLHVARQISTVVDACRMPPGY